MTISTAKPVQRHFRTLDLVYIAAGAALIAVCSWISIPTAVPFTMQTFAVFLLLSLLGGKRGTLSVLVYLMLGAAGLPVFAEFTGGIGVLFGSTGGYFAGFLLLGVIYMLVTKLFGNGMAAEIAALTVGLAVCHAFGTAWFMLVYTKANGAVTLGTVLGWCVFPFVLPDLVKLGLALTISRKILPLMKGAH